MLLAWDRTVTIRDVLATTRFERYLLGGPRLLFMRKVPTFAASVILLA